jgi:hypothetical protein
MPLLKVSSSGQVYDADLPQMKVTRDQGGGYYVHGRGHWIYCEDFESAERKKRDIEAMATIRSDYRP